MCVLYYNIIIKCHRYFLLLISILMQYYGIVKLEKGSFWILDLITLCRWSTFRTTSSKDSVWFDYSKLWFITNTYHRKRRISFYHSCVGQRPPSQCFSICRWRIRSFWLFYFQNGRWGPSYLRRLASDQYLPVEVGSDTQLVFWLSILVLAWLLLVLLSVFLLFLVWLLELWTAK